MLQNIPRRILTNRNHYLKISKRCVSVDLYNTDDQIRGKRLDQSVDLTSVKIGQTLEYPYEHTVSGEWRTKWQSCFFQQDRIQTSQNYCSKIHFKDVPLPFDLALFYASSMTHVEDSRDVWELRLTDACYNHPIFPGDTMQKTFQIKDVRDTADGKNIIVDINCKLIANGKTAFSVTKTMMYTKLTRKVEQDEYYTFNDLDSDGPLNNGYKSYLQKHFEKLPNTRSINPLTPGQLVLHNLQRPLGLSSSLELATLFRMVHPQLVNTARFDVSDLVLPGPVCVALTLSASAREFFEVIFQTVSSAMFVAKLNPMEPLGAVSYVTDVKRINHKLEEVSMVTIGIKNLDVVRMLESIDLPESLFTQVGNRPSFVINTIENKCPVLKNNVVCHLERKIIRMTPKTEPVFLL